MELKTAAAYIRVSSDDQTELSPDSQIKVITQYASDHGYIIPKEFIFREDGISGKSAANRPMFNRMIAHSKQKPSPFSTILLWKFSRFARNQEESIFYKSMLKKNGVDVVSVSEPIIEGAFGTLIERIIEWMDEYYIIRLAGEVRRGMTEKVDRGGAVSIPSFGYNIEKKQYVVNPDTAPIVRQIFADYANGTPSLTIARRLNELGIRTTRGNLWENRTVDYILQNPVYIGKICWCPNGRKDRDFTREDLKIVDGVHEPIIDEETFNKVQDIFIRNKKIHPYVRETMKKEYMLHGLIKCSACGASLSLSGNGGLQCIKYTHGKCKTSHYIKLDRINRLVLAAIKAAFITQTFDLVVKTTPVEQIDYDELLNKEFIKLERIKDAYEEAIYSLQDYAKAKAKIEDHIQSLREAQEIALKNAPSKKDFAEKNRKLLYLLRDPDTGEAEKNAILKSFVDKIIFHRSNSHIDIFFYT